ncbi:MAG: cytochrome c family protein [Rhodospirillales bacterium]|nr:cytochrome c family protein [Rhodospirillales bacterium]
MHFSCWEKLGFGVLVAAWVAFGSNFIGDALIHADPLEQSAYQVVLLEDTNTEAPQADSGPVEDAMTMLASVDLDQGEKVFGKCKSCHSTDEGGKNGIGPNLWDIVERAKGGADGYKYSDAMLEKGGNWSYADLDHFLTKPKDFVPKTKMSFQGLKKASDRAAVVLYLRSLSASPKPLP